MLLEVVVIYIGAGFLTEYGPKLAECLGVPDSLISLTLVAVGTSLPEAGGYPVGCGREKGMPPSPWEISSEPVC